MKKHVLDFIRRGLIACGIGPIILAVVYLFLKRHAGLETLTVEQVATGIVSLSALAFIAGGTNAIYQIEQLPLMWAISIHGGILYVCYLATYLVNGWLENNAVSLLVFSGVFVAGYLVIWAIIYVIIRRNTRKLNEMLQKKQQQ